MEARKKGKGGRSEWEKEVKEGIVWNSKCGGVGLGQ